ncbi:MAG: hypothetical protein IKW08_09930 [Roseburia sp.]|nr:hypothetical protein [Roseburia sp.]
MRIVFWGSERGCGVTSNMLIVATYLACKKGYRIAMMELAEEKQGIETYFPKIEEYHMNEFMGTLIRRKLYYVSMREWKREKGTSLTELIKYLELNMDIVFVNLANRTDEEAKNQMWNANLVVVNLKQRDLDFDRYYAQYANLSKKSLLLIGNYYENEYCNKESLQKKYRIPKGQLAVIPNNPEYQMACEKRSLERYIRRMQSRFVSAIKDQFIKAVGNVAEQIHVAAFAEEE